MQKWLGISLLLCTFGFFRELRPSEPYVTEFLTGPWRNLTAEQVNQEVYPFGVYSILAQLVIVFLITDIVRYKPMIVLSAVCGIILFAFLLWTKTLWELKVGQIFFGTFTACEVAYYTYIYAKVDKQHYQQVTGQTRGAILCGKFLAGVLAQIFISTNTMNYRDLNYISFGSQVVSLFIAISLPPARRSLYFYVEKTKNECTEINPAVLDGTTELSVVNLEIATTDSDNNVSKTTLNSNETAAPKLSWRNAASLIWQHIVSAYTNPIVIRWSCWWAFATCGQLLVITYVQFLWKEINDNKESYYNGGVEATVTLLGAAGAMAAGFVNSNRYKKWHMWILSICSLIMGAFLIISAITHIIWVAYIMYIIFGIIYFFVITIASATVAENLTDDSFGLIFGINTLFAMILQTVVTVIFITDDIGYGLSPRNQFIVYGSYFLVLAGLYFLAVVVSWICRQNKCCQIQETKTL